MSTFLRQLGLAILLTSLPWLVTEAAQSPAQHVFLVRSYDGTKKCLDYGARRRTTGERAPLGPVGPAGPTVFLNDCAHAHAIGVVEINSRHDVQLYAGTQVIGIHNPPQQTMLGAPPPPPPTQYTLELQSPANPATVLFANQVFALDGDSIILESSRPCASTDATLCPPPPPQLVFQVSNGSGVNGTPIVVGPRTLADSEFWRFAATDKSGADPTSGFVHVATNYQLWNAVCASPTASAAGPASNSDGTPAACATLNAGWNSVIEITSPYACNHASGDVADVGACIDLSSYAPLPLVSGMTLRGDRSGTNLGPQLYAAFQREKEYTSPAIANTPVCEWCMLQVHGDYVRITGLRMRGQSRTTKQLTEQTQAIDVDFPSTAVDPLSGAIEQNGSATSTEYIAIIDHNDISDWESAAVSVNGGHQESLTCKGVADDDRRLDNVRVERNFLHDNERDSGGYGTALSHGGRAHLAGNTYLLNRHAITADGESHSEYQAWYNLVLSTAPYYGYYNQDFDMHGTADAPHFYGGQGGYYVDIFQNTFLPTSQTNYELRGTPCKYSDFHSNVSLMSNSATTLADPSAVSFKNDRYQILHHVYNINIFNQAFQSQNPTDFLSALHAPGADFDGDGSPDLFLATGAAWYYSPGGNGDWRFLSAKTDTYNNLLFGDFDGDGRTDVITKRGNDVLVSWGGTSDWQKLNSTSAAITDLAVGDFDGDGRADIFYADGKNWYVSSGGSGPFVNVNSSSFRVKDVLFGDFDGDGKTDVFGVVAGTWSYSKGARGAWSAGYLRPALTTTVDRLVAADFDGDGRADVAMWSQPLNVRNTANGMYDIVNWDWKFSHDGVQAWASHRIVPNGTCRLSLDHYQVSNWQFEVPAVGRFGGRHGADVLLWNGNEFCILAAGVGIPQLFSRQDMR